VWWTAGRNRIAGKAGARAETGGWFLELRSQDDCDHRMNQNRPGLRNGSLMSSLAAQMACRPRRRLCRTLFMASSRRQTGGMNQDWRCDSNKQRSRDRNQQKRAHYSAQQRQRHTDLYVVENHSTCL